MWPNPQFPAENTANKTNVKFIFYTSCQFCMNTGTTKFGQAHNNKVY